VLTAIEIENFRCIERAQLDFDPLATVIVGPNASGKTSLLEAIYFLGHGRSFRTSAREKLLGPRDAFFRIVGRIALNGSPIVAGAEYSKSGARAHLAGESLSSISDIAAVLPIQVIDPGVHRLIEEGSARRRRLMDWGVFHVKHEFLGWWRRYQRALRQRNAALRNGEDGSVVDAWETELSQSGIRVDELRAEYVLRLQSHFALMAGRLINCDAQISYRRGWSVDAELAQALKDARPRDQRVGTTTVGPHRADLNFTVDGTPAKDRVSRGQQKMLAAAFVLAQVALRSAQGGTPTCLMLDDPAAELDVDNLGKLLASVTSVSSQLIMTSVNESGLRGVHIGRRFHVEQGRIWPVL